MMGVEGHLSDIGERETAMKRPGSAPTLRDSLGHATAYPPFRPPLLGAWSERAVPAAPADTRPGDGAGEIPRTSRSGDHTFIHR